MRSLIRTRLYVVFIIFATSFYYTAFSQSTGTAADSLYFRRLEYVCKVWGYLKYFHSGVNENSAWDDVLLGAIDSVKSANTPARYDAAIEQILAKAGKIPEAFGAAIVLPEERKMSIDYTWMHDSTMLRVSSINSLDLLRRNFRPLPNYFIDRSGVGTPMAANENTYSTMRTFDERYRLLALFRYWNIINYFYPYKDYIGRNWDVVLRELIPLFVNSTSSPGDYGRLLYRMSAQINDSHGFMSNPFFTDVWGNGVLPIEVQFVEGKTVVPQLNFAPAFLNSVGLSNLRAGDIITTINGESVDSIRKRLTPFIPASNPSSLQRDLNSYLLYGSAFEPAELGIQRGTEMQTFQTRRVSPALRNSGRIAAPVTPVWRILDDNIGYVDMARLQKGQIPTMINDLSATRGIIFDVRNYPEFILYDLCAYLGSSVPFVMITAPDYQHPGTFSAPLSSQVMPPFSRVYSIGGTKRYQGVMVALMNETSQSRSEFTLMGFRAMGMKLVGSQTAGTDGDVVTVPMPGNVVIYYTSLGVYYPDGKPTQRIGIVPHVEVKPTIAGIRDGRDEVLERGIKEVKDLTPFDMGGKDIKIFPNPVRNSVQVAFNALRSETIQIRLFTVINQMVSTVAASVKEGTNVLPLETTGLANGVYFCQILSETGQILKTTTFVIAR